LRFRALSAQRVNGTELITRIGLHTGVANVGNFGSDQRVDYTAIGENINLASRMEGLNKYLGTRVLITGDTQKEVGSRLVTRYLGLFRLKGFEKAVAVYELIAFLERRPSRARCANASRPRSISSPKRISPARKRPSAASRKSNPTTVPRNFTSNKSRNCAPPNLPPEWKGEITLKDK
jgi:hypothetical protein